LVYVNQRRAIIAIEKGSPGERAFNDAFATWGSSYRERGRCALEPELRGAAKQFSQKTAQHCTSPG